MGAGTLTHPRHAQPHPLEHGFTDDEDRKSDFFVWLQCYTKQTRAVDALGRAIWFDPALPRAGGAAAPPRAHDLAAGRAADPLLHAAATAAVAAPPAPAVLPASPPVSPPASPAKRRRRAGQQARALATAVLGAAAAAALTVAATRSHHFAAAPDG